MPGNARAIPWHRNVTLHPDSPRAAPLLRPGSEGEAHSCAVPTGREPGRGRPSPCPSAGGIRILSWSLLSSAALAKFGRVGSEGLLLTQAKKTLLLLCLCLQSSPQGVPAVVACSMSAPGKEGESLPWQRGSHSHLFTGPSDARSSASLCLPCSRGFSSEPSPVWSVGCLQTPVCCGA